MSTKRNTLFKALPPTLLGLISFMFLAFFAIPSYAQNIQTYGGYITGGYTYYGDNYYSQPNTTIATGNATNITSTSATLNGQVNGQSVYSISNFSSWFQYGASPDLGHATGPNSSSLGYASYSANISSLTPNTVYYFRAVAQTPQGIVVYGSINTFKTNFSTSPTTSNTIKIASPVVVVASPKTTTSSTTLASATVKKAAASTSTSTSTPLVTTAITTPASSIDSWSVQLNSLIYNGGNNSFAWFDYGTTPNLDSMTTPISTGAFPAVKHVNVLNGLKPNTTYYFRAVVVSPSSRSNGSILTFTTSDTLLGAPSEITNEGTISEAEPAAPQEETAEEDSGPALEASAIQAGFFPISALGWVTLIVFVLILVILSQLLYRNLLDKKPIQVEEEIHHT
jgi:hypothetical protein